MERRYDVPDSCGLNANKAAEERKGRRKKQQHIDQDMLSRKMNLQGGVSTLALQETAPAAAFNDRQHCINKCHTTVSRGVTGETHLWDVHG